MTATENRPATMRAHAAAAMHATAAMISDPTVPVPQRIDVRHHVHDGAHSDRVAYVEAFAERYGLAVEHGDNGAVWTELPLATRDVNGVEISFSVQTHGGDR